MANQSDRNRLAQLRQRYEELAHAMQTGVANEMGFDTKPTERKHLRVGVNAAMSDQSGLATLLISKGLITEEEYYQAVVEAMEREVKRYEALLSERLGVPVTLL